MQGLGWYIHVLQSCWGGDLIKLIEFCKSNQVSWLAVKHYDYLWHPNILRNPQLPELGRLCLENDIQLWVWEFNRVAKQGPEWNAEKSAELARQSLAHGLILNDEDDNGRGWNGAGAYAKRYLDRMEQVFHGPLANSSYRFPSTWPQMPWKHLLPRLQYTNPQIYFVGEQDPRRHVERSMAEYAAIGPAEWIPIYPCYQEHGWRVTPEAVQKCLDISVEKGLKGASFWWLDWAHKRPEYLDVIRNHPWRRRAYTDPPGHYDVQGIQSLRD